MNIPKQRQVRTILPRRLLNLMLVAALILGPATPAGAWVATPSSSGNTRTDVPAAIPDLPGVETVRSVPPATTVNFAPPAQPPSSPQWVFQGPAPQLNAQQDLVNVAAADEPVSGAVTAIAASPTNPDVVYVGTAGGGIWKSTNASADNPVWAPLTDNLRSLSIGTGAVVFDPTDATGQTIVVGTGRLSGYGRRGDDLDGLYYSTDGGATWTTTTSPLLSAATITGVAARGNTLLVASEGGLYRTTTGLLGAWAQISGTGILPNARASSIAADPTNINRLYVTFTGATGGIFRTDDLGATWANVTNGISVISSATDTFNAAVFNDGSTNVISVVLNGTVGGATVNAIFRSVNGAAFEALDVPTLSGSAWGNYQIVADRTNPNIAYVGGGYGVLLSNPFLPTVYRLDASQLRGSQATLLSGGGTYGAPHVDINHLALDVGGGLLMGVHGGIFRLPDPKAAASASNTWVSKNGNLGVTEMHDIAYDSVSSVLLGANQDNAVVYQSAPGSHAWAIGPSFGGDGGDVTVDNASLVSVPSTTLAAAMATTTGTTLAVSSAAGFPAAAKSFLIAVDDEQMLVTAISGTTLTVTRGVLGTTRATHNAGAAVIVPPQSIRYAANQSLGSFRRQVYNASNTQASNTAISYSTVTDAQFTTPLAVNALQPKRMLIGGTASLYETLDFGYTISKIATIGVSSRAIVYGGRRNGIDNPDVLYVGFSNRVYARTTTGGAVAATTVLPAGAGILKDIVINPTDWMNVFAIDDNQVFATADGGATWSDITGGLLSGLSSVEITTIEFVSGASPYIAVGTRSGAFASLLSNLGTWVELGASLPDVLVFELAYNAADDVLAAATLGRGAWLLSDASSAFVPSNVAPILAMTGPTATNEGSTQYTYSFTVSDPGDQFAVNGPAITGGALVPGSLTTTSNGGSFKVTFLDGPSSATVSLQVTDSSGLASNTATTSVTVANVGPTVAILGAPTSGSPGTTINLTSSVTDPSTVDQVAGFTYEWLVQKYSSSGALVSASFATGNTANFSYTPDVTGSYKVYFRAKDKDNANGGWVTKTIAAASPDLTENAVSVTVGEGVAAANAGTYAHNGGGPIAISATGGTVYQPFVILNDDFNGQSQGSALTALSNFWNVGPRFSAGYGVDVFGPGFNDYYPGFGNYLELDANLGAGTGYVSKLLPLESGGIYELSFAIGTNLDGPANNSVRAYIGSALGGAQGIFDETLAAPTARSTVVRRFTVTTAPAGAYLIFQDTGPSDGYGAIIDDVNLVRLNPQSVPPMNSLFINRYMQLGEDDAGAVDGAPGNATSVARRQTLSGEIAINVATVTREGAPTYTAATPAGSGSVLGMSFNGVTDAYVSSLANPASTVDDFGIEAWVNPASAAGRQVIMYNGDTGANGYGLTIESGNFKGLYGGVAYFDTGVPATPGIWRHIALVRDSGVTKMFVDGTLVLSDNVAAPNQVSPAAGAKFAIGRSPQAEIDYFSGSVDEVRVFLINSGPFAPQQLLANTSVSGTWAWSLIPDDGPAQSQVVTITASTGVSGDASSIPFLLTVENLAPSASLSNNGPISEGNPGTVSFSDQFDPSAADTTAGFRYAYDLDNDGVFDIGDGTYAGSTVDAATAVPASFLADGPAAHTVLARILDKDGGFTDYTTEITIANAVPAGAISGPTDALAGQVVTFLFAAADAAPADKLAGFTYAIDWGDSSPLQSVDPVAGTGNATARHAYATTGNYTVQVIATDKDGGSSAPATASIQVNALTTASLQALIATSPIVYLSPADDAALQNALAAINSLAAPPNPVDITMVLGAGPYNGVTLSPPQNIILDLAGNDTQDSAGTQIASNSGPAVTVTAGEVFVQGNQLATSADAPTVLVTGGHLTLGQSRIQESTGFNNVAVAITIDGLVNFGFDLLLNVNGEGGLVNTPNRSVLVPHPVGIDAELTPNTFQVNGVTVAGVSLSATQLASSSATTTPGQPVTFAATIQVKAIEHGPATGTVNFFVDGTLSGSGTVNKVDNQFVAMFTTATLSVGTHTILAIYSGDNAYVASSATMTHEVVAATNQAPVANADNYATTAGITLTVGAPGVLGNDSDADGDALTAMLQSGPGNGALTLNADGAFTYAPQAGFAGNDRFTYVARDGNAISNLAAVTITVNASTGPFATCGGYDVFERAPGVYEAPGFAGTLLVGTSRYDWIIGTNGPDLILGLQGPDDLWGRNGNDVICGGDGVDIIQGGNGDDILYGDEHPDWLIGDNGNDTLFGGNGWDDLDGNNGQDTLYGEDGYDVLLGGTGGDDLYGGNGPDDLYGENGNDALNGGSGNDFCLGGAGNDTITACEGASGAAAPATDEDAIDEAAARLKNDGENGEYAIVQRILEIFLPLITGGK